MFRPLRLTFLCLIVAFTTPVSPDIIWRKLLGEINRTEGDETTMGDLAGILDDEIGDDDAMKRKDPGPGAATAG